MPPLLDRPPGLVPQRDQGKLIPGLLKIIKNTQLGCLNPPGRSNHCCVKMIIDGRRIDLTELFREGSAVHIWHIHFGDDQV